MELIEREKEDLERKKIKAETAGNVFENMGNETDEIREIKRQLTVVDEIYDFLQNELEKISFSFGIAREQPIEEKVKSLIK